MAPLFALTVTVMGSLIVPIEPEIVPNPTDPEEGDATTLYCDENFWEYVVWMVATPPSE